MSEFSALHSLLRQSAPEAVAGPILDLIETGKDHELNRVNVLAFAAARGLGEEAALGGFLHAAQVGLFELSWNVLCPGCGGVLDANATLKTRATERSTTARSAPPATSRRSTRWSR